MKIFAARTADKKFGEVTDAAAAAPALIIYHRRPRAVVISYDLYKDYRAAYDQVNEDRYLQLLCKAIGQLGEGRLGGARDTRKLARETLDAIS